MNSSINSEKYFMPDSKEKCFINKIVELDSYYESIKQIFILLIFAKIINLFNEKFIILIVINIIFFYGPLEKKCPYFLFKSRMFVKQIFEGIFGIIRCIIPKYEGDLDKE